MVMARLLPRAEGAPQAGELDQQPHLKTRARRLRVSLTAATRVVTQAATRKKIVVRASLPPTTNLPTLRVAVVAAGALAAVVLVALVAPAALALGVATCPGTRFGSS